MDRELKRRTKQREKDAKKAESAAAAPQSQSRVNEDDLNPNVRDHRLYFRVVLKSWMSVAIL